jgi:outer membrane protein OmpA-like peptidoglycan-associated protein
MNICNLNYRKLATAGAVSLMLGACASPPGPPDGAADARTRLNLLQANSELASHAPIEIQDAEVAVKAAENSVEGTTRGTHLVLLANQKIEIADAWAQSRLYEDQRTELTAESEAARLAARTREADLARSDAELARNQTRTARDAEERARIDAANSRSAANVARSQSATAISEADAARSEAAVARTSADIARDQTAIARNDATIARNQAELAQLDTEAARAENDELQRQILALNALATERGLVVTLGDVMFETGKADLRGGIAGNLDSLAAFLNRFPERTVTIEGHTDNVGTDSSNMTLSQNRAESVESYLVSKGVADTRMLSTGSGESSPVADNGTETGRQQNRRVEVIISNPE